MGGGGGLRGLVLASVHSKALPTADCQTGGHRAPRRVVSIGGREKSIGIVSCPTKSSRQHRWASGSQLAWREGLVFCGVVPACVSGREFCWVEVPCCEWLYRGDSLLPVCCL